MTQPSEIFALLGIGIPQTVVELGQTGNLSLSQA